MISKYRTAGITAIALASLAGLLARTRASNPPNYTGEIPLRTTQSRNAKPSTPYPTGQPQAPAIESTIASHTAWAQRRHRLQDVENEFSDVLTPQEMDRGKIQVLHQRQAVKESVDDLHRDQCDDDSDALPITYVGTQEF